jgi:hypothetical protein
VGQAALAWPPRRFPRQFTVNVAVSDTVPAVAVIVTVCVDGTFDVVIVNVTVVLPCGTITSEGAEATSILLVFSCTICPPAGAGPDNVTVPVAVPFVPPVTSVGDTVTLCNCPAVCGFTVNAALCDPTP